MAEPGLLLKITVGTDLLAGFVPVGGIPRSSPILVGRAVLGQELASCGTRIKKRPLQQQQHIVTCLESSKRPA